MTTCVGDVTSYEDAERMVETTLAFAGQGDVLVNNAAIDPGGSVTQLDPALWRKGYRDESDRTLSPHEGDPTTHDETGRRLHYQYRLPRWAPLPTRYAGVCLVEGRPHYAHPAGSLDYGPHKIRCNAVCPGATRTTMIEHSLGSLKEKLGTDMEEVLSLVMSMVPLRRMAAPKEITGICSYLASDDSTFMTGSVLLIDGGSSVVDVSGATLTHAGVEWGVLK